MKTLLLDSNYLAYQARYTLGDLSHDGVATGVIFGFLSRCLALGNQFQTNRLVFCWDSRKSIRREIYPEYKANRRLKKTDADLAIDQIAFPQFDLLREQLLFEIGFQNVFMQEGLESDDLLAVLAESIDNVIIVTADADLFQCIRPQVRVYNPSQHKMMSNETFQQQYGITPSSWADVKAIAGCSTDNVSGIKGVGEKTAIKYLRKELKTTLKKYRDIQEHIHKVMERNSQLVYLPHPCTKDIILQIDNFPQDNSGLTAVAKRYGLESFVEDQRWADFFAGKFHPESEGSQYNKMKTRSAVGAMRARRSIAKKGFNFK